MPLADKIIELRKKQGWSQTDLADRLDVSRQSVSKWEMAQAVPELDKIIKMSELFAVTTDYLLKEGVPNAEPAPESPPPPEPEAEAISAPSLELKTSKKALQDKRLMELPETEDARAGQEPPLRQVSLGEAEEFVRRKEASARPIALAVALCILSPICLLYLSGRAELAQFNEGTAVGIGLVVLLAFVVPAVAIFVTWGLRLGKYEYIEKEVFAAGAGVPELARTRMEAAGPVHTRRLVMGICLCVASAVPIFAVQGWERPLLLMTAVCLLLALVAVGVYLILTANIPWGAYQMLLQEGDYAPEQKDPVRKAIVGGYWLLVTAGYLAWSFVTNAWDRTWIIWPVAGVLFGIVAIAAELPGRRKR